MPNWDPGSNPFPSGKIERISDFEYVDELNFVRHAKVHVNKKPKSLWQLSAPFRARMTLHPVDGASYALEIKAPRGLVTDLASVPEKLWGIVGPIGSHLEASILHDYLYMGWTDFRDKAKRSDQKFADKVFLAGMKVSRVRKRRLIYRAVRTFGWPVFKKKKYKLKQRMDEWLPLLEMDHGRNG